MCSNVGVFTAKKTHFQLLPKLLKWEYKLLRCLESSYNLKTFLNFVHFSGWKASTWCDLNLIQWCPLRLSWDFYISTLSNTNPAVCLCVRGGAKPRGQHEIITVVIAMINHTDKITIFRDDWDWDGIGADLWEIVPLSAKTRSFSRCKVWLTKWQFNISISDRMCILYPLGDILNSWILQQHGFVRVFSQPSHPCCILYLWLYAKLPVWWGWWGWDWGWAMAGDIVMTISDPLPPGRISSRARNEPSAKFYNHKEAPY